mmetsp:Transcript_66757/g.152972  ORF Transcript_66757/g.152972 Transcript_66757/m.152972 type:complete len:252 (-) Transcript_66757:243-998(-)
MRSSASSVRRLPPLGGAGTNPRPAPCVVDRWPTRPCGEAPGVGDCTEPGDGASSSVSPMSFSSRSSESATAVKHSAFTSSSASSSLAWNSSRATKLRWLPSRIASSSTGSGMCLGENTSGGALDGVSGSRPASGWSSTSGSDSGVGRVASASKSRCSVSRMASRIDDDSSDAGGTVGPLVCRPSGGLLAPRSVAAASCSCSWSCGCSFSSRGCSCSCSAGTGVVESPAIGPSASTALASVVVFSSSQMHCN